MKGLLTFLVPALLVFALALVLQGGVAEAAPTYGTITITVRDYHGNPLPDAYVCLRNGTACYQAKTGSNGQATWSGMKLLELYDLNVTYLGRMVREIPGWNYSRTSDPKDIRTGVFDVKICVVSAGRVEAVQGASVGIRSGETDPDVNRRSTTQSDGCVTFQRLPGNGTSYQVNATFQHQVFNLRIEGPTLDLSLDRDNYDTTIIELPLYRLRLTVNDRNGRPVRDLDVNLWRGERAGQPQISQKSDSSGVVVFRLLPAGRYVYEVAYRGDVIYTVDPPENLDRNRDRSLSLPLTPVTLELYDQKNKPLTAYPPPGFRLTIRLFVDSRLYFEATEQSSTTINAGYVYDERDYRLVVLFEGQEVFSGVIRAEDVKSGRVQAKIRFGDFSVALDIAGLYGNLPKIMQRAVLRLQAGTYSLQQSFGGGLTTALRDQPLVQYSYQLLIDGSVIGEGTVAPAHGESRQVRPTLYSLRLNTSSLDQRPVVGRLKLTYGNELVGELELPREGVVVEGLVKLPYRYVFTYEGVEVAGGTVEQQDLEAGRYTIAAAVGDVRARILDNAGREPLRGALVSLTVATYGAEGATDEEGWILFRDAPITSAFLTVYYQGVKVYSAPINLVPQAREVVISGTGVYDIRIMVRDGVGEPLGGAEVKLAIGTLVIMRPLAENATVVLSSVPNGTATITVTYLEVPVYSASHRIMRNNEEIEIAAKVYPLSLEIYARTRGGTSPLDAATVNIMSEERVMATLTSKNGRAGVKLPAGNYLVYVTYMGARVGDRLVSLTGTQKIVVETSVYEVIFTVLDLDGKPVADLDLNITREAGDVAARIRTGSDGSSSTLLPEGIYNVEYGEGEGRSSIKLGVNSVRTWTLLYGNIRAYRLAPLITAPLLVAISIFGLYSSFKRKAGARPAQTQRESQEGASTWTQRERRRLRRNV